MNLLNTILIAVIVLIIINLITNGKLLKTVMNTINPESTNLNYNLDEEMYNLHHYINNLITPNTSYRSSSANATKINADAEFIKNLKIHLDRIFNSRGYTFENIKILNKIRYYENQRGLDIEPFHFSANVKYNNKLIHPVIIYLESYLSKKGYLVLINARLVDKVVGKRKVKERYENVNLPNSKTEKQAIEDNNKLMQKNIGEFNNYFVNRGKYDDLFIKPTEQNKSSTFINDTDNSLIPSIIELSNTYEETSDS